MKPLSERDPGMPLWQKNSIYAVLLLSVAAGGYHAIPYVQQYYRNALLENVPMSHGEKQVRQMLADRPNMATYTTIKGEVKKLTPKDSIWQWVAKSYDFIANDSRIFWDNSDLTNKPANYTSESSSPYRGYRGFIRIRSRVSDFRGDNRELSFEELWVACIFELFNIRKGKTFLNLYTRALSGQLNRSQYVRGAQKTEYQSFVELKHFFSEVWEPWAKAHGVSITEERWQHDLPSTYEGWIASYQNSDDYRFWEDAYDTSIAPYVKKKLNSDKSKE